MIRFRFGGREAFGDAGNGADGRERDIDARKIGGYKPDPLAGNRAKGLRIPGLHSRNVLRGEELSGRGNGAGKCEAEKQPEFHGYRTILYPGPDLRPVRADDHPRTYSTGRH